MHICFVLPKYQHRPIGGYKIVYEYANRLVEKGFEISIVYMNSDILLHYRYLPKILVKLISSFFTSYEPRWFSVDKRVHKISNLNTKHLDYVRNNSDVIVATGIKTVDYAFSLSKKAKRYYLIQDFENWNEITDEQVYNTYKTDSTKIVISSWLKEIVDNYSPTPSILIHNPIDLSIYRPIIPVLERNRYTIGVLYHIAEHKGFDIAYSLLITLKSLYPSLEVFMFGGFKPAFDVPPWIHFTYNATQEDTVKIYNQCRVFLCTSRKEGFGLTGMEAMACGCVLISSDYSGVREYASNELNSLITPLTNIDQMLINIQKVFSDDDLTYKLSENGRLGLYNFSWENAINSFIDLLVDRGENK